MLPHVRNTRFLLLTTGFVATAFTVPFVLGEAAWAFALLIAPLMLLAIAALPLLIWSAGRAAAAVVRGEDPRRWVLAFSAFVLAGGVALIAAAVLRFTAIR